VETSPFGYPFYYFVPDPYYGFPEELKDQVKPQGINILDIPDLSTLIIDVVGKKHYPHFTDWLQESNVLGISRRISQSDLYGLAEVDLNNAYFIVLHKNTIVKQRYMEVSKTFLFMTI